MTDKTRQDAILWIYKDDLVRCLETECTVKAYSHKHENVHTGNVTTIPLFLKKNTTELMTDEEIAHTLGWSTTEFLTSREKRDARKIEQFLLKRYL